MTPTIEDLKTGKRFRELDGLRNECYFIGLTKIGNIVIDCKGLVTVGEELSDFELIPDPPREFWVNIYPDGTSGLLFSKESAKELLCMNGKTIHLREVIE